MFSKDGTQMVIIASQEQVRSSLSLTGIQSSDGFFSTQGSNGGYRHLTLVNAANGNETPLTSGRFVVQDILKWDSETNRIFYTANTEENSQVQHIYAVKAVAGQFSQCLTCGISYNGINQTYFTGEFSISGNNLVLVVEGPSIPRVDIYSWSVDSKDG